MTTSGGLDDLEEKARRTGMADDEIRRELERMHAEHGSFLKPEDFDQDQDEETTAAAPAAAE